MTPHINIPRSALMLPTLALFFIINGSFSEEIQSQIGRFTARDPGVRSGSAGVGGMIQGLTPLEQQLFSVGRQTFQAVDSVQGTITSTDPGLGPRFNLGNV